MFEKVSKLTRNTIRKVSSLNVWLYMIAEPTKCFHCTKNHKWAHDLCLNYNAGGNNNDLSEY